MYDNTPFDFGFFLQQCIIFCFFAFASWLEVIIL